MIVKNEEHRYLREVLADLEEYVDEIVILDDGSTDDTIGLCKSFNKTFVETLGVSLFKINQRLARETLYKMTIERNPDFILGIDADEIFEYRFKQEVREMVDKPFHWYSFNWYSFNRYDFWTPDSYHRIFPSSMKSLRKLFKYCPKKYFSFTPGPHCGSTPEWVRFNDQGQETDIRFKHFGFIRKEDRLARIQRNKDTGNGDYAKK
ncbi:unnamed protein product [marine sediment metagenome]|uniref:Glycosyltransferase 2-like domain-containing protein n=1 Tax=marine sediment metagenome TaxID=412755 RepID=X1IMH6_9ZZZZ